MRKIPFILGPLLILAGAYILLMGYVLATMVDPAPEGRAWWRQVPDSLLGDPVGSLLGVGLIVVGFRVAASGGRESHRDGP